MIVRGEECAGVVVESLKQWIVLVTSPSPPARPQDLMIDISWPPAPVRLSGGVEPIVVLTDMPGQPSDLVTVNIAPSPVWTFSSQNIPDGDIPPH